MHPSVIRKSISGFAKPVVITDEMKRSQSERQRSQTLQVQKLLQAQLKVDVCVVMDCTGSMGAWMDMCKKHAVGVLRSCKDRGKFTSLRVAFVGYRDFGDENHLSVLDFTENIQDAVDYIAKEVPSGGGDEPEDVLGAIETVANLSWRGKTRVVIHVADAPSHGAAFNNGARDDHLEEGTLEKAVAALSKLSMAKVAYFFGHVQKEKTATMIQVFNKILDGMKSRMRFRQCDLNNQSDLFTQFFTESLLAATQASYSLVTSVKPPPYEEKWRYDPSAPPLTEEGEGSGEGSGPGLDENINFFMGEEKLEAELTGAPAPSRARPTSKAGLANFNFHRLICAREFDKAKETPAEFVKDVIQVLTYACETKSNLPYIQKPETAYIDEVPFDEGACRTAHYGFLEDSSMLYVFKKEKKEMSHRLSQVFAQRTLEIHMLASCLATAFNEKLNSPKHELRFTAVRVYIDPSTGAVWSAEPFLEGGKYEKYNSNCGFVSSKPSDTDANEAAQAFSHFTYQASRTSLMIVDLQGVGRSLTDAAMHSTFATEPRLPTDLMTEGHDLFFRNHECNDLCRKLKLMGHPAQLRGDDM